MIPRLPTPPEAKLFWWCAACGEATYHRADGTCQTCGTKTVHIPREANEANYDGTKTGLPGKGV